MILCERPPLANVMAFAAATALFSTACGSSTELGGRHTEDGGGSTGDASSDVVAQTRIPKEQLATALVHALCDNLQRCCASVGRDLIVNCAMSVELEIGPTATSTSTYDPVAAARCVQTVAAISETCSLADARKCLVAFGSALPLGARCYNDVQCAGDPGSVICGYDGHCVQAKRGALGDPCMVTCLDDEDENPPCNPILDGLAMTGAACHFRDGLFCVRAADGAATCQPTSTFCGLAPDRSCPPGQVCNRSMNRCEVPVGLGASCATSLCVSSAYCKNGVCTLKEPSSAACSADAECESNLCNNGACSESFPTASWCGGHVD